MSWLSPVGWVQQTRVFVDDRWWPLLLNLAVTVVLGWVGYWLSTRRDVGTGLAQARPGPAYGSSSLSSSQGLAWRLQRTSLLWWSAALFTFGLGYGTLASEVETFVSEMEVIQDAIAGMGGSVIESWLAVIVVFFAAVAAIFGVLAAQRARGEETEGRAEPVLATPVSKPKWLAGHVGIALVGSAGLMLLTGLGLGLTASQATGDSALLGQVVGAALAHVPGIWLIVGIGVALFGLVPRAGLLIWAVIAYAGLVGWLGTLLGFPDWAMNLSPLGHTPMLPAEEMVWTPLVIVTLAAGALLVAGLAGFRRRDIQSTA